MKSKMQIRKVLISLFIVVLFLVQNVDAADINQYFNTWRNGSNLSDSANVDKIIPSEYSFGLGSEYDSVTVTGGQPLSSAEINKWKAKTGEVEENIDDVNNLLSKTQYLSKAVASIKDNFSATYKNVGRYDNQSIDVKVTVDDFEVTSGDFYYSDYAPFILFLDKSFDKLGVYVMNIDWIKLRYDFYKSGTTTRVPVKGYTSYFDVDQYHGIHILDNNKGIYTAKGVKLKKSTIDNDNSQFIYESTNKRFDGFFNPEVSFTELFEGSSITRVFTPARSVDGMIRNKINRARGVFYNSSVTAVPRKEYAENTAGESRTVVKKDDVITYKVSFTNVSQTDSKRVTITDKLSKGLEYVKGKAYFNGEPVTIADTPNASDGTTTLEWGTELAKDSTGVLTYQAKVTDAADVLVNNGVTVKVGTDTYTPDVLKNPIPKKEYANGTAGANGAAVKKDNIIKYSISYANPKKEAQKIVITDVLSKGFDYVDGKAYCNGNPITPVKTINNENGTTTLVFTRDNVSPGATEVITYEAKVNGTTFEVKNKATVKYELDPVASLKELRNPVPQKMYASDSPFGKNGAKVKEGNTIKYSIKYVNTFNSPKKVTITDVLSIGLEYVEGSATSGFTLKSKTRNPDFTTTLVFEKENVAVNASEELTYSALVLGDVDEVKNKASLEYDGSSSITLNELINPIDKPIDIDNVGSVIAISGIILGIALIGGGGYTIYSRYKKS